MQSCCIRGCDSYKQTTIKNIGYFKFPLHDDSLLNNWLREINRPNWKPCETSQICSLHFKEEDLIRHANRKHPLLFPTSIPTVFPIQRKSSRRKKRIVQNIEELNMSAAEIEGFEPHRNKVSLLRRKRSISSIGNEEDKSEVESKLRNVLTKSIDNDGIELVYPIIMNSDKPLMRISVNKKLNLLPAESKPAPFETIFLPYHGENDVGDEIKVDNEGFNSQKNSNRGQDCSLILNQSARSKFTSENRSKTDSGQFNDKLKLKDCPRVRKKTQSQDNVFYSFPRTVKVHSLNPKTREESENLQKRLDELRERRKREQLKIVRLQMHLNELEKKMKDNNKEEEIVLPNLGKGSKKPSVIKPSWLIREKEEYEKLLKDVREIKLKVLRERHNRELEKIRKLQIQMTNLSDKMRENDEKEIALSNFRATNIAGVVRPDWMKREEEEYEKLLQDVRKIKQSYKSRKAKKQECNESDLIKIPKSEKVLSNEDCILIETMQEESRLIEKIDIGDGTMNKINQNEDNDEYGEVIGLIDDDSIDIDISKEITMVNFNEELPDPGLLDS